MNGKESFKLNKPQLSEDNLIHTFALPSAVIAPAYVFIWMTLYPEIPLYEKLIFLFLAFSFLIICIVTRLFGIARRHVRSLYHIIYHATSFATIYFTARHGFSDNYSISLLMIAFYVSMTFEKLTALLLYLVVTLLFISVFLYAGYAANGYINRNGLILLCSSIAFSVVSVLIRCTRDKDIRSLFTMAHYDPITNLANRNYLEKYLTRVLFFSENTTALMFIDLDKFKMVNDTLGHGFGDLVLNAVALEIKKCITENDFLARYGGDEFIVVIPNADRERVIETANRIISLFTMPLQVKMYLIDLSSSIGISLYPQDGGDADTLINNADIAMYYVKSRGRNNYKFYQKEMSDQIHRKFQLENGLKNAFKNDEFILYYQPEIDMRTGRINSAEALIRWKHPAYGLVPPKEFIPLAEESGYIIPIGAWVLRTACMQNKAWQDMGYEPITISVNVSYHQLIDNNFIFFIQRALEESKLAPEYLELEITESVLRDTTEIWEVFEKLKLQHIKISIDDFGVGYSSLSMLQYLEIDRLKIDMSFIRDIPANRKAVAIIKAIVDLGDHLSYSITAEGVETREQAEILYQNRCHLLQGYLFSKPVDPEEFRMLLKNWKQEAFL